MEIRESEFSFNEFSGGSPPEELLDNVDFQESSSMFESQKRKKVNVDFQKFERKCGGSPKSFLKRLRRNGSDFLRIEIAEAMAVPPRIFRDRHGLNIEKWSSVVFAMRRLTFRQRTVLRRCFGLWCDERKEQQIAQELRIAQPVVSEHKWAAIKKIQKISSKQEKKKNTL